MTDNEIIREAIELFAVQYFDTIEMSGTVKQKKQKNINYFSLDLNEIGKNEDINNLHQRLSKYLTEWARKNGKGFKNYYSITHITIEYLLPKKDGSNQNQSKHIDLFKIPAIYFQNSHENSPKPIHPILIKVLNIWYNIILRNTILVSLPTFIFILISYCKIEYELGFIDRLSKAFDYVNIASGIIASFVLGFLINKVVTLRGEKLSRTKEIKMLSNQLTYFRNICYNLERDHVFWSRENPNYDSYQYGRSILNKITFEEYRYPNYSDNIEYAKFTSLYNGEFSNSIVTLVLQLHMMADESFHRSGLTFTDFPPNYIYSLDEMEQYLLFSDTNQIWYCSSESKIFPKTFTPSHSVDKILKDIKNIYPSNTNKQLSNILLEETSLDFQYRIIPRLYRLTKLNESALPLTINYFKNTFLLLLAFGIILPTLTYIFFDKTYSFLSVFIVIAIISHILLSLKSILNKENTLDRELDYI